MANRDDYWADTKPHAYTSHANAYAHAKSRNTVCVDIFRYIHVAVPSELLLRNLGRHDTVYRKRERTNIKQPFRDGCHYQHELHIEVKGVQK